jgi:ATP-dependent Lhr-like helicase
MKIEIEHPLGVSDAAIERMRDLILEHVSTLIFVNTRETAELLGARFKILDPQLGVKVHHGSLSREARTEAETGFKNGALKGLICTSSMELGIDIGSVDLVIQYNSPRQVTRLLQRIGRSGHKLDRISVGKIIATDPDDIAEAAVVVKSKELEEIGVHDNPLDVLANQLYGMALTEGVVSAPRAYAALKRSWSFKDLKWKTFVRVLRQLKEIGNLWWDEEKKEFSRRRGVYTQYFSNISMIPDEKSYTLVDMTTNRKVGTLDESFVLGYGAQGAPFITGGEPWQAVETDDQKLLVKAAPAVDLTGAIPSWVGEEIPVSFEIAQGVGRLRDKISKLSREEGMEWILKNYPMDENSARSIVDLMSDQKKMESLVRAPVPTDRVVTIEMDGYHVVINALFGHKVNETLALLISSMISTRLGAQVLTNVQPYRIVLELPSRVKKGQIEETLRSLDPKNVEWMIDRILKNSSAFQYRLVQIAKRFGFLTGEFRKRLPRRVLEMMRESVMFDEAVREVKLDRLDLERTQAVLERIKSGVIEIASVPFISPIGKAGERYALSLVTPKRADKAILEGLRKRLMKTDIRESCINCGWSLKTTVEEMDLRCPICTSQMIAVIGPYDESYKLLKKRQLTKEEKKEVRKMAKNAGLVVSYGKRGAMVLAGRGIGPDTASRILRVGKDEISLLRDVLEAEINYARTKRFWD